MLADKLCILLVVYTNINLLDAGRPVVLKLLAAAFNIAPTGYRVLMYVDLQVDYGIFMGPNAYQLLVNYLLLPMAITHVGVANCSIGLDNFYMDAKQLPCRFH